MQIDSLELKIKSSATGAIKSLDSLERKLISLNTALSSVNGSGIQSMSQGLLSFGQAVNALKGIDSRTFSTLARNIQKISSINVQGLYSASSALQRMSSSLASLSGVQGSVQGIVELSGAIRQLGYKSVETAINNMPKLAKAMQQLMRSLSTAPRVSRNLIDMTNALARLTNSGFRFTSMTPKVNKGLSSLSLHAKKTETSFKGLAYYFGKFYANCFLLIRAFRLIKSSINLSSQLTEVQNVVNMTFGQMSDSVDDFAKNSIEKFGMSELSAKQFASRFQAMGSAMGIPLEGIGSKFDYINNKIDGMSDSVKELYSSTDGITSMSMNLTKLAADMASFYNVAQEDVADDLASVFTGSTRPLREYGLDLTQATLKEWAMKNGLNANIKEMSQAEKTMLRYQYVMANADKSMGDFAKTSGTWANQTRMLTENIKALGAVWGQAFINMLKPLVKSLNEAMIAITSFSVNVINALGKIFGWKIDIQNVGITEDFEDAGESLDDANESAKKLKNNLLGIDELNVLSDSSGSGSGSSSSSGSGLENSKYEIEETEGMFNSLINNMEELGTYVSKAIENALDNINYNAIKEKMRKIAKNIADFLNGFITPSLFAKLGENIAEKINAALAFLDEFGFTFNWSNFGSSLASGLNEFVSKLDWKTALSAAENWGKGIADALNSFLKDTDWTEVGRSIANFINTKIQFFFSLGTGIDWESLGQALHDVVDGAIKQFDAEKAGYTVGAFVRGIATSIYTFLKDMDTWKELGQKIADGINGFLSAMGDINSDGKNGWQVTADMFNSFVDAVKEAIKSAIKNTSWSDVFKGIGDFIGEVEIDTLTAVIGVLVIKNILEAHILSSALATVGRKIATSIAGAIGASIAGAGGLFNLIGLDMAALVGDGAVSLGVMAGMSIIGGIISAFAGWNLGQLLYEVITGEDIELSFFGQIKEIFKSFFDGSARDAIIMWGKDIIDALNQVADDVVSWMENTFGSWAGYTFADLFKDIFNFDETIKMFNNMKELFKKAFNTTWREGVGILDPEIGVNLILGIIEGFKTAISFFTEPIRDLFDTVINGIKSIFGINSPAENTKPLGEYILLGIVEGFKNKVSEFDTAIKEWFDTSVTPWFTIEKWSGIFDNVKQSAILKWDEIKKWFDNTIVVEFFSKILEKFTVKYWTEKFNSINIGFKTTFEGIKKFWHNDVVAGFWNQEIKPKLSIGYWINAFKGIKDGFAETIKNAVNLGVDKINQFIDWLNDKLEFTTPEIDLPGGIKIDSISVKLFDIPRIPTFATGGFPEDGWFRASHGEYFGQFDNGRSVIANNNQITGGIALGVMEAVREELAPYLEQISMNTRETANKDFSVNIGDRDIARASIRGQQSMGLKLVTT